MWYRSKALWTLVATAVAVGAFLFGGMTPVDMAALSDMASALVDRMVGS